MTRPVVLLPEDLAERIVAHCLAELPNEGCGLFAIAGDGRVVAVYPTSNQSASPASYTVPPEEHHAALVAAESAGWRLGGVFHSHPYGSAELSMVDLQAAIDPEWVYLVVGMRGEPEIRGWRVRNGEVEEVEMRG
ncbi:MAG: Mov34/MPN/PAD-1 family protein [Acidimicrobiia bacterium]